MGGKTDIAKGRVEEAAGAMAGNDKLRNKGKTDQAVGKLKQISDKAIDQTTQLAASKKPFIAREQFCAMVSEAAYFAAQEDENKKSSAKYWVEAEDAVRDKFNVD